MCKVSVVISVYFICLLCSCRSSDVVPRWTTVLGGLWQNNQHLQLESEGLVIQYDYTQRKNSDNFLCPLY